MEKLFSEKTRVSKNYLWHGNVCEFEDLRTHERRGDSVYAAKVDVYEDRVKTWFLDFAKRLVGEDMIDDGVSPGDYVALSIALAYVEGEEQYRRGRESGRGESGEWFKASVKRMLPAASDDVTKMLWESARCGLFHSGFTKDRVYLSHALYTQPLELTIEGKLKIDPARFVGLVVKDFEAYVHELRENPSGEDAKNFERLWDQRWATS